MGILLFAITDLFEPIPRKFCMKRQATVLSIDCAREILGMMRFCLFEFDFRAFAVIWG